MRATLANWRVERRTLWIVLRRLDLERRLALILTILAVVSGLATYAVITRGPPVGGEVRTVVVLLNVDLVLLLLLGVIVARRIVHLVLQWRRGSAGSRLHTRLVALFAIVAATPAILVSIFSVIFLSSGLEAWFSDRVRDALHNSLAVAQAYLAEHKENIKADALAMAADLNRESGMLQSNTARLRQVVNAQAQLRALTEAIIFDSTGQVLAHTGLAFTLEIEALPVDAVQRASNGEVVTLTSDTDDRVRALVRLDGFGDAYLFVGRFVDANVLGYMERTQRVVAEYQRMERERSGIQITSALIFAIVALLLLLASVWVGLNIANSLVAPVGRLIIAADRVRGGDYLARVPEVGGDEDELADLSRAFNRMTSQLATQRRELIEANQQLDDRRRFTETVLAGVTAGVLGLDRARNVVLPNRSAREFLDATGEGLEGRPIAGLLPGINELFERLDRDPGHPVQRQLALVHDGSERTLLVRLAPQRDEERIMGYVVTFDDVTALLSAQRQAAWSEVARRIAHEVKNPLTPIRLSAERLARKYLPQLSEDRESFQRSVTTIIGQVDQIGRLIGEFSAFARMPQAVFKPESVAELLKDAVFLQQQAWPQVRFELELATTAGQELVCDGAKVTQALTNLIQNAAQAVAEAAGAAADRRRVIVRTRPEEDQLVVEVEDFGPGFASDRERLFEPYVTTRSKGTGLGLAIVRKIMEEHAGTVDLLTGRAGGGLVRLSFPVRAG